MATSARGYSSGMSSTGSRSTRGGEGVASVHVSREEGGAASTCLRPKKADLTFQKLGTIHVMIAVDGVENLGGVKDLYIHRG